MKTKPKYPNVALSDLTLDALIEWLAQIAHDEGDWSEFSYEIKRRFAKVIIDHRR